MNQSVVSTRFPRSLRSAALIVFAAASMLGLASGLASAQVPTRSVPATSAVQPENPVVIAALMKQWQAIQGDLRTNLSETRRPEYELRILAREVPDTKAKPNGATAPLEKFTVDKLPARIVLVLGGLQGAAHSAERFAMALGDSMNNPSDTRMAVFNYPNDGSLCDSASVLRELLTDLQTKSPQTKVAIVAHSMGGLVARHAIEPTAPKTESQVPCVDQLIMLCPPNHGSVLAQYGDALELPDALSKLQTGGQSVTQVMQSLVNDGLGEACEELVPDSPCLLELNGRARAAKVRYSIIAGTGGPITPLVRLASSIALKQTRERTQVNNLPNAKDALDRADALILSDEFAQGLGDGAVSLKSAKLAGVSDFTTAPIHHGEWAQLDRAPVQQLVQQVAMQLKR